MYELSPLLRRIARDLDVSSDNEDADNEIKERARHALADAFFQRAETLLLLLDAKQLPDAVVQRIRLELDSILDRPFFTVLLGIGRNLFNNTKPADKPVSLLYMENVRKMKVLCEDFTVEYIELTIEAPDFPIHFRDAIQVVLDELFPQMDDTALQDNPTE